jgi:hypothetical protein
MRQHIGDTDEPRGKVEATDAATVLLCQKPRGSTNTAAHIDNSLGPSQMQKLSEPDGRATLARMKLVHGREIIRRQALDIFAGLFECGQYRCAKIGTVIITLDSLMRLSHDTLLVMQSELSTSTKNVA